MNFRNSDIFSSFGSPKGRKAEIHILSVGGNEILFIVPLILFLLFTECEPGLGLNVSSRYKSYRLYLN